MGIIDWNDVTGLSVTTPLYRGGCNVTLINLCCDSNVTGCKGVTLVPNHRQGGYERVKDGGQYHWRGAVSR